MSFRAAPAIVFYLATIAVHAQTIRCGEVPKPFVNDRAACRSFFLPDTLPSLANAFPKEHSNTRVDLGACFPTPVSQGPDGTCYAHAAAAVMEAAARRRDGVTNKLAEEDFMALNYLMSYSRGRSLLDRSDSALVRSTQENKYVFDGGWARTLLKQALVQGYVNAKDPQYSNAKEKSFDRSMTALAASHETIQLLAATYGMNPEALNDDVVRPFTVEQIKRRPGGFLTRGVGIKWPDPTPGLAQASTEAGSAPTSTPEADIPRLRKLVHQSTLDTREAIANAAPEASIKVQRDALALFQDHLAKAEETYAHDRPLLENCYQAARPLLDWILNELCAGRPVSISVQNVALRQPKGETLFGDRSISVKSHAVVVQGATYDPITREPQLVLRDSAAPDLKLPQWLSFSRACRITSVESLVVWKVDPTTDMDNVTFGH